MKDIFAPPKAKAPVIFKVKIASTLAFHIQFWVQKRGYREIDSSKQGQI